VAGAIIYLFAALEVSAIIRAKGLHRMQPTSRREIS
jgi:hypothetical protein